MFFQPGRVVTLLASKNSNDQVWGLAYKISSENIDNVVHHLDFREKDGYEKKTVLFYPCDLSKNVEECSSSSSNLNDNHVSLNDLSTINHQASLSSNSEQDPPPFYLTIYIGEEDNPNYAGMENIDTIARHILISRGISGFNTEYLYKLASAMRTIAPGIQDEHLFTLERAVKKLENDRENSVTLELDECLNHNQRTK